MKGKVICDLHDGVKVPEGYAIASCLKFRIDDETAAEHIANLNDIVGGGYCNKHLVVVSECQYTESLFAIGVYDGQYAYYVVAAKRA